MMRDAIAPNLGAQPIDLERLGRRDASTSPSEVDKAYAAGFFDGEGHITIAFMSAKARTRGVTYTMRIGASQNDLAPLLWLRDRWGGSVSQVARRTAVGNATYRWVLCSRKAAGFIRDVYPWLKVKARRAEVALRFQDALFIPGKAGHTLEYRAMLEALRVEMTGLNTHKPRASATAAA